MRDTLNFSNRLLNEPNYKILLIGVIFLTVFFRLWKLPQIPPGMYNDEAINASQGLTALEQGEFTLFFKENFGRESLFVYLVGASAKLFGETKIWSARLPSTASGILGVAALYFLAKLLTNKEIALYAAFFMAVDLWHVNISRIAFRVILIPAVLGFSLYFLVKGFRKGNLVWFGLGGLLYGLGFYSYTSYRITPLLLMIAIPIFFLDAINQNNPAPAAFRKKAIMGVIVFLMTAFITALPIGLYFLNNPDIFWKRSVYVSIFSGPNAVQTLLSNIWKTIGMFNIAGDANPRHNLWSQAQLYWPIGILFVVGFAIMVFLLFQGWKNKDWSKLSLSVFLISYLGTMVIPTALSVDPPHALRTLAATTPAYFLSGIGLYFMLNLWNGYAGEIPMKKFGTLLIILILFVGITIGEYNRYFIQWANDEEVKIDFLNQAVIIAYSLEEFPENSKIYITADNITDFRNTIYYLSGRNDNIIYVSYRNIDNKVIDPNETLYFIPIDYFNGTQENLENILGFPLEHNKTDSGTHYFTNIKLP